MSQRQDDQPDRRRPDPAALLARLRAAGRVPSPSREEMAATWARLRERLRGAKETDRSERDET